MGEMYYLLYIRTYILVIMPSVVMESVTVLAVPHVWKGHLVSWDGTSINASLFTVAYVVGDRKYWSDLLMGRVLHC